MSGIHSIFLFIYLHILKKDDKKPFSFIKNKGCILICILFVH